MGRRIVEKFLSFTASEGDIKRGITWLSHGSLNRVWRNPLFYTLPRKNVWCHCPDMFKTQGTVVGYKQTRCGWSDHSWCARCKNHPSARWRHWKRETFQRQENQDKSEPQRDNWRSPYAWDELRVKKWTKSSRRLMQWNAYQSPESVGNLCLSLWISAYPGTESNPQKREQSIP